MDSAQKIFLIVNLLVLSVLVAFLLRRTPRAGLSLKLGLKRENFALSSKGEKTLNIIFNYNGHSWDAYEVLGLPAGTSLEKVTDSYLRILRQVDPSSREFVETAYQAIRQAHSS